MLSALIAVLEQTGFGLIVSLIHAIVQSFAKSGLTDSELDYLDQLVGSAQVNPALDTPAKKFQAVYVGMRDHLAALGRDIADSLLRALIELNVQKRKQAAS